MENHDLKNNKHYKIYTRKWSVYIFFLQYPPQINNQTIKNGGKIWILRDWDKGFSERPEKVHFWKNQFQNLFQKSKIRNFAAIFVYIGYMNGYRILQKDIYIM
jgi:hypothetical protein